MKMGKQQIKLEVQYKDPRNLKPNKRNVRQHPQSQIDAIAKSIAQFGFTAPALIDEAGVLIAGHARVIAAQQIGLAEIPVIQINHLSKEQVRALMLADNRLGDASSFDMDLLAKELGELAKLEIDIPGFSVDDIAAFSQRRDLSILDELSPLEQHEKKGADEVKIVLVYKKREGMKIQSLLNGIDEDPAKAVKKLLEK